MKEMIFIRWRDSNIIYEQTDEKPKIAVIETCGWLLNSDPYQCHICRDIIDGEYRGQIVIPAENIIYKKIYETT